MDDTYTPLPADTPLPAHRRAGGEGNSERGTRRLDRWLGDGGMPLLGHMGVSINGSDDGRSWARWVPTSLCCNPRGVVQAGVYTVVLDATMSVAMLSLMPRGEMAVSLDVYTTTTEPARDGSELSVVARVVRQGGATIFAAATVSDGAGRVVAEARGTYAVRRRHTSDANEGGARAGDG